MRHRSIIVLTAVVLLLLAACADDEGTDLETPDVPATDEPATEEPATEEPAAEDEQDDDAADPDAVTVSTAQLPVGEVLVDGDGLSLYVFDNDEDGESTCYDDCESTWPPLVSAAPPAAEGAADQGLLGTTTREDGSTQVTYNGRPLYYFATDSAAGDINGQGIGDVWWLIDPAGEAVEEQP